MKNSFRKVALTALILVYVVIIAGAVVRMTGSGMGCPDWPKCFGHYIPPTTITEVEWQPNTTIKKGQIIIVQETLQVAKKAFKTNTSYNSNNWEPYVEHDYAQFNPVRTWIEYINRLVTVILGIPMLILLVFSFRFLKKDKVITFITVSTFFVLCIQAVLGKIVVDTHLKPIMISVHMVIALLIMLMLLYLVHRTTDRFGVMQYDKHVKWLLMASFAATFIQIILGIEVRQFIDVQIDVLGEKASQLWLQNPTLEFYLHRSFSMVIILINVILAYRIFIFKLGFKKINWILLLIVAEALTGIAMNYFNFPFASQPLHLLLASLLFGVQFYLILEVLKSEKSLKSL